MVDHPVTSRDSSLGTKVRLENCKMESSVQSARCNVHSNNDGAIDCLTKLIYWPAGEHYPYHPLVKGFRSLSVGELAISWARPAKLLLLLLLMLRNIISFPIATRSHRSGTWYDSSLCGVTGTSGSSKHTLGALHNSQPTPKSSSGRCPPISIEMSQQQTSSVIEKPRIHSCWLTIMHH